MPASVALLIGAYPPERRTQMVALWGGIGALAVATGPSRITRLLRSAA